MRNGGKEENGESINKFHFELKLLTTDDRTTSLLLWSTQFLSNYRNYMAEPSIYEL